MNEKVRKIAEESMFGSDFNEKCKSAQTVQNALKD